MLLRLSHSHTRLDMGQLACSPMNDALPRSTCTAHLVLHLRNLHTEQQYVEDQINQIVLVSP